MVPGQRPSTRSGSGRVPSMIPSVTKSLGRQLPIKEFVRLTKELTRSDIKQKERILTFLHRAYGGLLTATVIIIILQGFHLWGFNLEAAFLNWLGLATVGEVGGLITLVYGAVFRKPKPGEGKDFDEGSEV